VLQPVLPEPCRLATPIAEHLCRVAYSSPCSSFYLCDLTQCNPGRGAVRPPNYHSSPPSNLSPYPRPYAAAAHPRLPAATPPASRPHPRIPVPTPHGNLQAITPPAHLQQKSPHHPTASPPASMDLRHPTSLHAPIAGAPMNPPRSEPLPEAQPRPLVEAIRQTIRRLHDASRTEEPMSTGPAPSSPFTAVATPAPSAPQTRRRSRPTSPSTAGSPPPPRTRPSVPSSSSTTASSTWTYPSSSTRSEPAGRTTYRPSSRTARSSRSWTGRSLPSASSRSSSTAAASASSKRSRT
jgi:hypothetical protein